MGPLLIVRDVEARQESTPLPHLILYLPSMLWRGDHRYCREGGQQADEPPASEVLVQEQPGEENGHGGI